MDEKTTHKKCKKQTRKLNQSGKINEKVRRLPNGTFIIALSLLELIQKIFKTREKFQSHFINYSYQMGDVSLYARKKVQLKSFNGIFIASGILCNFMSTILHQARSVFFFIIKKRGWK